VGRVLLLVQRRAIRVAVRIRLCARDRAAVPRSAAGARPVLDRPRPDEPRLPVHPPAAVLQEPRGSAAPVLQAGWPGDVDPDHEPGPVLRGARAVAREPHLVAARGGDRRPDPDAPLLRAGLAAVRLPLRARLDPVRVRALWPGGGAGRGAPGGVGPTRAGDRARL